METDTLSDVLQVTRLSGGMFFRLNLRAPFSVNTLDNETVRRNFAGGAGRVLPFHMVTQGPIWFEVDGSDPVKLESGDIIVIPHGTHHSVADTPGVKPLSVDEIGSGISGFPPTLTWGGSGPESRVLCGFFSCSRRLFNPFMESLPEVMLVRNDPQRTHWLEATLEKTFDETLMNRQGGGALIEGLTSLLFMEVVQRHLEQSVPEGWLAGLSDPIVGTALKLMHQQPAEPWTVESLAQSAAASRSLLADRFLQTVGMTPIKYLTGWRLELAAARLLESNDSVAEIAAQVGYTSETSFSRAFKRYSGQPPAGWRQQPDLELSVPAS